MSAHMRGILLPLRAKVPLCGVMARFAWWGAWGQPVNVAGIFIRKNAHRLWAFRVIIRYQENGVLGYWALQYSPDTGRASPSNATYTATFLYSAFCLASVVFFAHCSPAVSTLMAFVGKSGHCDFM